MCFLFVFVCDAPAPPVLVPYSGETGNSVTAVETLQEAFKAYEEQRAHYGLVLELLESMTVNEGMEEHASQPQAVERLAEVTGMVASMDEAATAYSEALAASLEKHQQLVGQIKQYNSKATDFEFTVVEYQEVKKAQGCRVGLRDVLTRFEHGGRCRSCRSQSPQPRCRPSTPRLPPLRSRHPRNPPTLQRATMILWPLRLRCKYGHVVQVACCMGCADVTRCWCCCFCCGHTGARCGCLQAVPSVTHH